MISDEDISFWENLKRTLKPLWPVRAQEPTPFPKRLRVHPAPERELLFSLDLHGLTVEQAYQTLRRFVSLHVRQNSKTITIITGKGSKEREGLIHREVKNWLETPFFREKLHDYRWLNGGGALELHLKRKKISAK